MVYTGTVVLKCDDGLWPLYSCPRCQYHVAQTDMKFDSGLSVLCKFCEANIEMDNRIHAELEKARWQKDTLPKAGRIGLDF